MASQNQILFHFSLLILIHSIRLTNAQNNFLVPFCSPQDNYTQDSPFRRSLDDAMSGLTRTNNGYGFFNYSSGQQNSDSASAIALCRGDTLPDTCWRCVDDATRRLRQDCPNGKEAIGWYDFCFLRYSNRSLLHILEENGREFGRCNTNSVSASEVQQFNSTMTSLLSTLQGEAARGDSLRKYASGSLNTSSNGTAARTIYGMVQCTPDLSDSQCTQCLEAAIGVPSCSDRLGRVVYRDSCFARFGTASFFNQTWYPSPPPSPSVAGKTNIALIVGPTIAAVAAIAILSFFVHRSLRRKRKQKEEDLLPVWGETPSSMEGSRHQMDGDDTDEMNYFNLTTIQSATNNFAAANKLGEGGFGPVYKGMLQDGKEIAVKRLSRNSGQGLEEFKTEVRLIVKLQHKNLVRLLGCCIKGDEKLLVYEYMVNTSLDAFLFDPLKCKELDWPMRLNIAIGIAKGLRYLHEDSRLKIVHRDMKAGNVLLDEEMNPKISDFGTARIFGGKQMEANTNRVVGTYGYMAPEYAMEGLFSTKSDVYSFGVLLLEIVSGKKNSGFYHKDQAQSHLSYAWQLWKDGQGEQFIDNNLIDDCPIAEALRWINIALLCVQEEPTARPTMSSVVSMLEGQWTNLPEPFEPPFSVARFPLSNILSRTGSQPVSLVSDQSSTSTTLG